MPWKETDVKDLRNKFIDAYLLQNWDMATLCRKFGISRKTGYKWYKRFEAGGRAALADQSRAPLVQAKAMSPQTIQALLEARAEFPHWGPVKLLEYLKQKKPQETWPAASTVGALLKRQGLSQARPLRQRTPPYTQPLAHATSANQVWCADFKGWFRTQDGQPCYPLTVSDAYSRYVLCIQALLGPQTEAVIPCFEATFRQYGLPMAIRTDNGAPFASRGLGGLTRLNLWWLHLGIRHERIEPGHPEQNGQHERMHRTLKAEATQPPQANLAQQQVEFDRFRLYFDEVRPHAALELRTPGRVYRASLGQSNPAPESHHSEVPHPSSEFISDSSSAKNISAKNISAKNISAKNRIQVVRREYPKRLPELEYPEGVTMRSVRTNGVIKWKGELVFVSAILAGESVGLREIADGEWQLYLGPLLLAVRDQDNANWLAPTPRSPATGVQAKA